MHLCNLYFKIEDGRKSPNCELQLDGTTISEVDCKPEREMFELSISHNESGVYECVVSTVEKPTVSTSVKVVINCTLIGLQACHARMHTPVFLFASQYLHVPCHKSVEPPKMDTNIILFNILSFGEHN